MEDLAEMARVGAVHPMETTLRLETLRRELSSAMHEDPERVANLAYGLEHCRSQLDRQLRHALKLLAVRANEVEILEARVIYLEGILQRARRPWWRWPR